MRKLGHHKDQNKDQNKEKGAVLLTTLLLLTVMAAITVVIMDDILFSVRRTTNIEAAEQMDWYGRGGEEYAKTWIVDAASGNQLGLNTAILLRQPLTLPIDDSEGTNGEFRLLIEDGRNCFNLNQFGNTEQIKTTRHRLIILLVDLDFDEQEANSITAHIQDWIDSDTDPQQDGAEEFTYLNKIPPNHPANTLMSDITELRAIEGIDEDIFERISPYLCALPTTQENKLNINSLRFEQAPLLSSALGIRDALKAAQTLILVRPEAGYVSIDNAWEIPSIEALGLKGAGRDKVAITTDRIIVNLQVNYKEQIRTKAILYALNQENGQSGGVKILARRGMF